MRYFTLALMMLGGSCAESAPAAEEATAATVDPSSQPVDAVGNAAAPDANEPTNAGAPVEAPNEAAQAKVTELPIRRGFYVAADTPCGQASNATLMLVSREGYGECRFEAIERIARDRYRVTERCSSGGPAWGRPEEIETSRVVWTIESDTAFTRVSEGGYTAKARHCEQKSLPDPWRDNDIRDIL